MSEAVKFLEDAAGYTEKEIAEKFVIQETETEWVIKAIGYLDGKTRGDLLKAITEKAGAYEKNQETKTAIFHLPKTEAADSQISQEEKVATSQNVQQEELQSEGEYALSKSMKGKLGQLVPCLQDAEGMVIDGFHRLKVNPKAWTVKIDHVKTPVDRALARMTVNFCRRRYLDDEMKNDIGLAAGSGYSMQDIHDITGVGLTTIGKYYPQELKDQKKSEAGKLGGEARGESFATQVRQTVKTQDTSISTPTQPQEPTSIDGYKTYLFGTRKCEKCGKPAERQKMHFVDSLLVCPECAGKKETKPSTEEPTKPSKPKETGDFRKAQMHPQKSKYEIALIQSLQAEGIPIETDISICAVPTKPDGIIKLKNGRKIAIYIDNEATHPEGNGRDEFLRGNIEKQGWEILPIRYRNGDSKEELQKGKEMVREFLKW
jgi:hypothetical protein